MLGVGREDDDGADVGEYRAEVAQERAEERDQLAGGHGKCARHGGPVLATVSVSRLQTVGHGRHGRHVQVRDRQPERLQLLRTTHQHAYRRWLQLRFDFDSTGVRRLIEGH